MSGASRVVQWVLIGLGFVAFAGMFAFLFGDGTDVAFGWTCGKDGSCAGATSEHPNGYHVAVPLGLLGIGLEVAAVAIGLGGRGTAAVPPAAPQSGYPSSVGTPPMGHGGQPAPPVGQPAGPGGAGSYQHGPGGYGHQGSPLYGQQQNRG